MKTEQETEHKISQVFKAFASVTRRQIIELLLEQEQASWLELHDGERSDMAPHIHLLEETGVIVAIPDSDKRYPNYRLADRAMCAVLLDEVTDFVKRRDGEKEQANVGVE